MEFETIKQNELVMLYQKETDYMIMYIKGQRQFDLYDTDKNGNPTTLAATFKTLKDAKDAVKYVYDAMYN